MTTPAVYGVAETLRELRGVDKALQRAAMDRMKSGARPLAAQIAAAAPTGPPLSGFSHKGRTAWKRPRATVKGGGRRKPSREFWPLVSVRFTGAAAEMADMAGRARPNTLGANLSARYGAPSRWVWPTAEGQLRAIQATVSKACTEVAADVSRKLAH
jgi:hypothetical protein